MKHADQPVCHQQPCCVESPVELTWITTGSEGLKANVFVVVLLNLNVCAAALSAFKSAAKRPLIF